jgi:drug/metabolite transporter (DMT)-like permease
LLAISAGLFALAGTRRRGVPRVLRLAVLTGLSIAGCLSLLAYGLVLWAQTRAPLAIVAALRETSVVFGALIGAMALREGLPTRRILASAAIAGGAAVLALG